MRANHLTPSNLLNLHLSTPREIKSVRSPGVNSNLAFVIDTWLEITNETEPVQKIGEIRG